MLTLTVTSSRATLTGWRYLWAKHVIGFDSGQHCAKCLRGSYLQGIGTDMPVNTPVQICNPGEGATLYLCGVSVPYQWRNNLHLPVRVKAGAFAEVKAWTGDVYRIDGAEALPIDGLVARRAFPSRSAAFLSCRNFQFGAQYF
jgi:hypothetical protein